MTEERRTETRIVRASAPSLNRFAPLRRWRWDVTVYRPIDGPHRGVQDRRLHLFADCGYTFTALGAAVAIGRRIRREP